VPIEYTLDAQDVAAARLLGVGIRPRVEFTIFAVVLITLVALSVSPWAFGTIPLLIGLTACLGAFRIMQISKLRQAAAIAFKRNETLRQVTVAMWDEGGITIQPLTAIIERIPWSALQAFKENERVVLFQQADALHAIPKRAFPNKAVLAALRKKARTELKRAR
jgi:YcxB-like protein